MASKKLYCRILDYLEKEHSDLATIFHNLCAEGFLSPRRKPGVTLLIPEDKKIIESLLKDSNSGDFDKMNKALEQLGALIIPFNIPSASSVTADMANSLGFAIEAKGSGDSISFPNGAKAVKDSNFAQFKKDPFLHVYKLSGAIPVSTKKADITEIAKKQKLEKKKVKEAIKTKSGGKDEFSYDGAYDLGSVTGKDHIIRAGLIIRTEDTISGPSGNGSTAPLFALTCSLLNIVKSKNSRLFSELCSLLTGREIDAYILIEPYRQHKDANKFLVSQECIDELDQMHKSGNLSGSQSDLQSLISAADARCSKLQDEISKIRNNLIGSSNISTFAAALENAYKVFYGGVFKQVMGADSHLGRIYGEGDGYLQKMSDDELRFRSCINFEKINGQVNSANADLFTELQNFIPDYMSSNGGSLSILRQKNEAIFDPSNMAGVKCFVNSTAFLYCLPAGNGALSIKSKDSLGEGSDALTFEAVWDIRGKATKRTGTLKNE